LWFLCWRYLFLSVNYASLVKINLLFAYLLQKLKNWKTVVITCLLLLEQETEMGKCWSGRHKLAHLLWLPSKSTLYYKIKKLSFFFLLSFNLKDSFSFQDLAWKWQVITFTMQVSNSPDSHIIWWKHDLVLLWGWLHLEVGFGLMTTPTFG
jgi:hypothetical protein